MVKSLVIVESPTKARSIGQLLRSVAGNDVVVEASMGHIRDLPTSAKDLPEKYKKEPWAYLAVDVDHDFQPVYVVSKQRRERIQKLKTLLADADELYLATDEDREGEAIAWHLAEVLKPKVPVRRMVFHEITAPAIEEAFRNPRDLDTRLVDAQEARRILDRLVGYDVSRVLWLKVARGLSAGRVQSVAVRIVVERERERMAFRSAGYWGIEAALVKDGESQTVPAAVVTLDGRRVATGRDFRSDGAVVENVVVLTEATAPALAAELEDTALVVASVETKPYTRRPYAPFRTSTLQQEAGRKLRFTSTRTMSAAQRLYENGYITYMRTDSVTLSKSAIETAREEIGRLHGPRYVPERLRTYTTTAKGAQEAHEAIRPAGDRWKTPAEAAREVSPDEARVYELIWKRTLASQMPDARGETVSVRIDGTTPSGRAVGLAAAGRVITFDGFLVLYVESTDDESEGEDAERRLPPVDVGDRLTAGAVTATGHETRPPRRYTEAALVQRLEELGVGRPSTYASIMSRIQDAGYIFKKDQALVPTFTAFAVVTLLEQSFPDLVDYAFTARMEDDLDRIAAGEQERVPWLTRFYLGDSGLKKTIEDRLGAIDARAVNSIPLGVDDEGSAVVARVGRYGPYVERGTERASIPEDLPPDELTVTKAAELLESQGRGDKILGTDPGTGLVVLGRTGRFGPYVQLGEDDDGKPKRASLLQGMDLDELSLDNALRLLSLPRVVGTDPDGAEILVHNGRYGPYVERGSDRRSLDSEERIFTITVEDALALLAEPPRRKAKQAASPVKEIGSDPASGKTVTLRSGRFGPYVTDGEVNASLRKNDDPESITIERAAELLAARRERLGS